MSFHGKARIRWQNGVRTGRVVDVASADDINKYPAENYSSELGEGEGERPTARNIIGACESSEIQDGVEVVFECCADGEGDGDGDGDPTSTVPRIMDSTNDELWLEAELKQQRLANVDYLERLSSHLGVMSTLSRSKRPPNQECDTLNKLNAGISEDNNDEGGGGGVAHVVRLIVSGPDEAEGSALTQEEKELLESSQRGELSLHDLEFREHDKDNTLMTPQELESMPERGLEFEVSVGPKETNQFSQNDCQQPTQDIGDLDENSMDVSGRLLPFTNGDASGFYDLATDSVLPKTFTEIKMDTSNNTTKVIINTPQGQQIIRFNTTDLLSASPIQSNLAENCEVERIIISEQDGLKELEDAAVENMNLDAEDFDVPDGLLFGTARAWTCAECHKVYDRKCKLQVHIMSRHDGIRPYKCKFNSCDWAFTSSYKLKRHVETHSRIKDYICEIDGCNRKFTTIYNLNSHKKLHWRPNIISCPATSCGQTFQTRRSMEQHMKEHGDIIAPYQCPVENCQKTYYAPNALSTHMKIHNKSEKDLTCPYKNCGKVFETACRLKMHVRQHTGERPYRCEVEGCVSAFVSASKLGRHMRKHTGDRRYMCHEPNCGKLFMRADHLHGHMIIHSNTKPFVCEICNSKFTAKSSWYVHLKQHKQGKPVFLCPLPQCKKTYNCKSSLNNHLMKVHSLLYAEARQLDCITVLCNSDLQEMQSIGGCTQNIGVANSIVSVPTIGIPVTCASTTLKDATLVSPSEFIGSAPFQPDIMTQLVMSNTITPASTPAPVLQLQKSPVTMDQTIPSSTESKGLMDLFPDFETLPLSRVQKLNESGSARTDFCCRRLHTIRKHKPTGTCNEFPDSLINPVIDNELMQSDVVLTTTAIAFQDMSTGTQYVQTQLLQDDLSPSNNRHLYSEDNLLVSVANNSHAGLAADLHLPTLLLAEQTNTDLSVVESMQTSGHSMGYASVINVAEYAEATLNNLREME